MANPEHVAIVRAGKEAIDEWRKENPGVRFDLKGAMLNGAELVDATLYGTDLRDSTLTYASLSGAKLNGANLSNANLEHAKLPHAVLHHAKLFEANLLAVRLCDADLGFADLRHACLVRADLSRASLYGAVVSSANLINANLSNACLRYTDIHNSMLQGVVLSDADVQDAVFVNVDLSETNGLNDCRHHGPNSVGTDTLVKSKGKIPETFLRGCGLSPWEIEFARLHDPALTANEISEIISTKLFDQRTEGPLYLGGCFISYSQDDSPFVDKLYRELQNAGAPVWLDRHDMVAGDMKRQVFDSIRVQDVVVLVLSKDSINSDWVETELKAARRKEKEQGRDVLCPVALDDSWEAKVKDNPTWGHLTDKLILDFSGWKTKKFKAEFDKLIKGMKINYTVPN